MRILLLFLVIIGPIRAQQLNACDLSKDGAVNVIDYQLLVNMALGKTPCTANINGPKVCNVITGQRIINAALGQGCRLSDGSEVSLPLPHEVALNWVASITPSVTYNIYRASTSGGPYVKLNLSPIVLLTYVDNTVVAGQTYYYVARAVDSNGNESANSNEARATIPSP